MPPVLWSTVRRRALSGALVVREDEPVTIDGHLAADGPSATARAMEPVHEQLDLPAGMVAPWGFRVVAALLDHALLAGVTYLAFPVQPVDPPAYVPLGASGAVALVVPSLGPWMQSGWVVGTVVVVVLMQAYLGATPGKLFVGLAVVREANGRPAGLLRTAGRALAHILDTILLIGYLRPLWNRRRQTFADSLAHTVVLVTRRPLTFRFAGEATDPHPWEEPSSPRWRGAATALAGGACLIGVGLSLGSTSTSGGGVRDETCHTSVPTADVSPFTLLSGSVAVDPGTTDGVPPRDRAPTPDRHGRHRRALGLERDGPGRPVSSAGVVRAPGRQRGAPCRPRGRRRDGPRRTRRA